jgi:hypothetical protein
LTATLTEPSSTPTSVFSGESDYVEYLVTLTFTGRLAGGAPSDPKLVEGWLAKNVGITDEEQLKSWTMRHLAEVQGIDPSTMTEAEITQAVQEAMEVNASEKKAQVFKRTPEGEPYIEPRQIKALLKEACSIAYPRGEHKWGQYASRSAARAGAAVGGKEPRSYLAERVFPADYPVIVESDVVDVDLAVGHITDPRTGEKRSTIGYFEFAEKPVMQFTLRVLDDCITAEQWARIWTVAELNGLGARRSQGCGQFVVTQWERV